MLQNVQLGELQTHSVKGALGQQESHLEASVAEPELLQRPDPDQSWQETAYETNLEQSQQATEAAQHSSAGQDVSHQQSTWPQPCNSVLTAQSSGKAPRSHRPQSRAANRVKPKLQMQVIQRSLGRSLGSAPEAGPMFSAKVQ